MDAATDESDSSVHFHTAAPAVQCASPEDPTIRISLLSSLTITGGFSLWGAARSSATPVAASRGESTTSHPCAGNVRRVPHWPPTHIPQQQQHNACQSVVSEGEGSDVLWHRPPPPPTTADSGRSPSPHNAGNKSETARVATPAAAAALVESKATGRAAQTQPSADEATSPTCNPRRRTVRVGLSSATPATQQRRSKGQQN